MSALHVSIARIIGEILPGRWLYQSLQTLIRGRVFEVIHFVQGQRTLESPNVLLGSAYLRLFDTIDDRGYYRSCEYADDDDDHHNLNQGETLLRRARDPFNLIIHLCSLFFLQHVGVHDSKMIPSETPNPKGRASRVKTALSNAFPLPLLTIIVVLLLLAAGGDTARILLRYERLEVLNGAWWRLITGHLVHLGWSHTVLNLAGLVLVWWLFRPIASRVWLVWTVVSGWVAISAGFLLVDEDLAWYVGLSGLLHALFASGAITSLYARRDNAILFLAALVIKLVWEQLAGPIPLTEASSGGAVVVDAHLWGALGGLLAGWVLRLKGGRLGYNGHPKKPSQDE